MPRRFHRELALFGWLVLAVLPIHATAAAEKAPLEAGRLEAALKQAHSQGRYLLVAFLGEGWSVSSSRFEERVLRTEIFRDFAEKRLVYFPVHARRKPKLSPEETAVLQSWVVYFDVKTYPTLILLAPDGNEQLRHGYRDVDGAAYVELMQALLPAAAEGR